MGGSAPAVPWRTAASFVAAAGRGPLLLAATLAVAQAALPLAGLVALMRLIDAVGDGLAGRTPTTAAMAAATSATLLAAGVALAGSVLRSVAALANEHTGRRLADLHTERVQRHAAQLDLAAFDRPAFHDLLQRAGAEASQRPVRLLQDSLAVSAALCALGLMSALLWFVEPWLPLLVAAAAVPLAFVRRRHADRRYRWQQQHSQDQREIGYFGAVLTGRASAKDVRLLGLLATFGDRLARGRSQLRETLQRLARHGAREELAVQTLASAGLFAAYWVLARDALAGEISLGVLVLQAQAAQRAQNGVRDLLAAIAGVREHRLFLRPLVDFLAMRPELVATPPPGHVAPGALALRLDGVTFHYPEATQAALRELTCAIAAGERVAVVGHNGSGKSTLLKLLARLYDPAAGHVFAHETPLNHLEPASYRARVAVLLQDSALYELTIRDNLQLGTAAPLADDVLWRALETTGLAAAIRALPQGLDTWCSRRHEGGVDWSAGQARRLLLARALAQPADLLLLDEPFAMLDRDGCARLATALAELPRSRTLVLIEHRAEALANVDRVLVLAAGRLVGDGSVASLAANCGPFQALFPNPSAPR